MKEYFELDTKTKTRILEFKKKAEELQLGNISFEYFENGSTINFYITEYKDYWELIVKQEKRDSCKIYWRLMDIYKINDDELKYESSERDLL